MSKFIMPMHTEKLTFTGHDTFHCRSFWLKKGLDFLKDSGDFGAENSVLKLGVGKKHGGGHPFLAQGIWCQRGRWKGVRIG
jgi:hypothetical protein